MMTRKTIAITRLMLGTAAIATLSACAQTPRPDLPGERHQIQVSESIERLEIYPRQDGLALSARDMGAMNSFLAGYRQQGRGPVYINSPAQGSAGISSAKAQVNQALAGVGLSGVSVQNGSYQTLPGAPAPLVVSYRRLKTEVPDCNAGDDLTATYHNMPSPNWGCAYHANIAAMVADPNQFLEPYPLGEPSSERRMVVYDKYINGQPTSAAKASDQEANSQTLGGG